VYAAEGDIVNVLNLQSKRTVSGVVVGRVTSGGFSPSLGHPIAMGFVPPALAAVGTALTVIVRGKAQAAQVVAMPFVPHRYVRKIKA
jgi:aminomethyltransferase